MHTETLQRLLSESAEQMKVLERTVEEMGTAIEGMIADAPDGEKGQFIDLRVMFKKAIELAKKGDRTGAEQLINLYKNGRKDNQQEL